MVRLKEKKESKGGLTMGSFNSTMVRLKDFSQVEMAWTSLFQFHYGTIKSCANISKSEESRVSIPLWYD